MDGNTGFMLWWHSLCERQDWAGSPGERMLQAAKYLVRAATLPAGHHRYLEFLHAHPLMRACVRRDPRLLERHLHRFIHLRWRRVDRLRSVHCHYRYLLEHWPVELFEAVYVRGGVTLGDLQLKDGSHLQLFLRPTIAKGCEGELSIELAEADGRPLYRLVLTVIDEKPTMAIGCIQGPTGDHARERVRELTRLMHGMRPKQLMLVLAYAFAGQCGIERILAVSNQDHPLHGRRRFRADYDAFWQEQGGVQTADGWYELPEVIHHRSEAEVASHHRSAFRRRAELRWQAVQLLSDALCRVPWWFDAPAQGEALESSTRLPGGRGEALWTS
ncbi:DUF535 family protein [Dyella sp. C9]|uniref:VirK/YbjX family protein n=1 Tax=Dyella sp. C9 TaxID=2202154 RepID=UPI0013001FF2|nr:DUF535 family protein [Dyella sp. C9]